MPLTYQQPTYGTIYAELAYNTAGITGTALTIGTIPAGANITYAKTSVRTAFNDTGTDYFRIGVTSNAFDIAFDDDVSTVTEISHPRAFDLNPLGADRQIYVKYTGSNADATAGELHVVIMWKLA